jgi:DNA-binding GntR family transcriptional regulator
MPERSITESIFLEVRFAVLSGVYRPGQILDREELCDVYGCKSAVTVDALNVLVQEGYLDIPRRGIFGVRVWSPVEIDDLFDIRASMMGMASARAAERATDVEIAQLAHVHEATLAQDFSNEPGTEALILRSVELQASIIKMARVATIADMARNIGPNAIFRQSIWAQNAKGLAKTARSLGKIHDAIVHRMPHQAQAEMAEFVELTRAATLSSVTKLEGQAWPEFPTIRRIECHSVRHGCVFGAGGREPALDGRIIPFGVGQIRSSG